MLELTIINKICFIFENKHGRHLFQGHILHKPEEQMSLTVQNFQLATMSLKVLKDTWGKTHNANKKITNG